MQNYVNTDSFIINLKPEDFYKDIDIHIKL